MAQSKAWDKEYQTNNLVTNSTEPQNDFKKFNSIYSEYLDLFVIVHDYFR